MTNKEIKILSEAIQRDFFKTYNKIKRLDENVLSEAVGANVSLEDLSKQLQTELASNGLDVKYGNFSSGALDSNNITGNQVLMYVDESGGAGTSGMLSIAIPANLGEDVAKNVQSKFNNIANRFKNNGIEFETKFGKTKIGNGVPVYSMMVRLKPENEEQPQQNQQPQVPSRPPLPTQ